MASTFRRKPILPQTTTETGAPPKQAGAIPTQEYADKLTLARRLNEQGVNPLAWTKAHPATFVDQDEFRKTGRRPRENQFEVGGRLYDWSPEIAATPAQGRAALGVYLKEIGDPDSAETAPLESYVDIDKVLLRHPFGQLVPSPNTEDRDIHLRNMIRIGVNPETAHLGDPVPMPMQDKLKRVFEHKLMSDTTPSAPDTAAEPAVTDLLYRNADGWIYAKNEATRESPAVAGIRRRHAEKRSATPAPGSDVPSNPAPTSQTSGRHATANDNDPAGEDEIFRHYLGRNEEPSRRILPESTLLARLEDVRDVHLTQAPSEIRDSSTDQIDEYERFNREKERLREIADDDDRSSHHDEARRRIEDRAEKMNAQKPKLVDDSAGRKQCILAGGGCLFTMTDNPDADDSEPWFEDADYSEVSALDDLILEAAGEEGVDPDLIRAIMYLETTHGYYDRFFSWFDGNKSILPMNINVDYWGDAFGTREELKDPKANITAGAKMLRALQNNLPAGAPVSHIATLYNNHRTEKVNDYGARVSTLYAKQPWKQGKAPEK